MRIEVHDTARRRRGTLEVDPTKRPPRAQLHQRRGQDSDKREEVFLNWDGAQDDAGHLRKCVVCGCPSLFRHRTLPSVTPIVVILAFAGAALGILGYATSPWVTGLLIAVLAAELCIIVVARVEVVCYRCRSRYQDTNPAPYHTAFDPTDDPKK